MKKLYLKSGETYNFNLYNDRFNEQTAIVTDSDGTEITAGVTNTWINRFGNEYTGARELKDGVWYEQGTTRVIKKSKISFTPILGGNVASSPVYLSDEKSGIQRVRLEVQASYTQEEYPGLRKFTYLLARDKDFPRNNNMINNFLKTNIPAGIIIKSILYPTLSDVVFTDGVVVLIGE